MPALGLGLTLARGNATAIGGSLADWYVSSVNGSDSNSGRSSSAQLQTLGALMTVLQPGQTVVLEDGSYWRERLNLHDAGETGVTVMRSGTGANRPIIDGANVINNASLVNNGVLTNTYNLSFTPSYGIGVDNFRVSVFEAGTPLTRVLSAAACNTTPGSFFAEFPTANVNQTVVIHPRGSTAPGSKLFEIVARDYGIYVANGCVIDGIEAMRAGSNNGAIYSFSDTFVTLRNCISRWGTKHMYVMSGGIFEDCQAIDIVPGNSDCIPFTAFDGIGTTRNASFYRCTAQVQSGLATGSAWYAHGAGSGFIRNMYLEDCQAIETSSGFDEAAGNRADFLRCTYTKAGTSGTAFTLRDKSPGGGLSVVGCVALNASRFINFPSGCSAPVEVSANRVVCNSEVIIGSGVAQLTGRHNSFVLGSGYRLTSAPTLFTWRNNVMARFTAEVFNRVDSTNNNQLNIRDNVYWNTLNFTTTSLTGASLATTQAAGIDVNSVLQNPGFAGHATGNFSTSSVAVNRLQAGWEYYSTGNAPTNVALLLTSAPNNNTLQITWDAPSPAPVNYTVQIAVNGGVFSNNQVVTGTTYTYTGQLNGVWEARIRANYASNSSVYVQTSSVTADEIDFSGFAFLPVGRQSAIESAAITAGAVLAVTPDQVVAAADRCLEWWDWQSNTFIDAGASVAATTGNAIETWRGVGAGLIASQSNAALKPTLGTGIIFTQDGLTSPATGFPIGNNALGFVAVLDVSGSQTNSFHVPISRAVANDSTRFGLRLSSSREILVGFGESLQSGSLLGVSGVIIHAFYTPGFITRRIHTTAEGTVSYATVPNFSGDIHFGSIAGASRSNVTIRQIAFSNSLSDLRIVRELFKALEGL